MMMIPKATLRSEFLDTAISENTFAKNFVSSCIIKSRKNTYI